MRKLIPAPGGKPGSIFATGLPYRITPRLRLATSTGRHTAGWLMIASERGRGVGGVGRGGEEGDVNARKDVTRDKRSPPPSEIAPWHFQVRLLR